MSYIWHIAVILTFAYSWHGWRLASRDCAQHTVKPCGHPVILLEVVVPAKVFHCCIHSSFSPCHPPVHTLNAEYTHIYRSFSLIKQVMLAKDVLQTNSMQHFMVVTSCSVVWMMGFRRVEHSVLLCVKTFSDFQTIRSLFFYYKSVYRNPMQRLECISM